MVTEQSRLKDFNSRQIKQILPSRCQFPERLRYSQAPYLVHISHFLGPVLESKINITAWLLPRLRMYGVYLHVPSKISVARCLGTGIGLLF
jgi:hypothetical protein